MIAHVMVQIGNDKSVQIEENMIRHLVLQSILSYKNKFSHEYGELVIACDGKDYWRKKIFPYYKAKRKEKIAESVIDWKHLYSCFKNISLELKEHFKYRVIMQDSSEADDIIGVLCNEYGYNGEGLCVDQIIIISRDKDFRQLQKFSNVKQYNPIDKIWIVEKNPIEFLREHIIRGDSGDGIPNIYSADNCFVIKERQKPIMTKKLEEWIKQNPELFCTEYMLRNYKRNEQLIDLTKIPEDIKNLILIEYNEQGKKSKGNLFEYFRTHRLNTLMENIGDF
jgi:hypothetical protein